MLSIHTIKLQYNTMMKKEQWDKVSVVLTIRTGSILVFICLWNARRIVEIEKVPVVLVSFGPLTRIVVRWSCSAKRSLCDGCGRSLRHFQKIGCGIVHEVTIMVQTQWVSHIVGLNSSVFLKFCLFDQKKVPIPIKIW